MTAFGRGGGVAFLFFALLFLQFFSPTHEHFKFLINDDNIITIKSNLLEVYASGWLD